MPFSRRASLRLALGGASMLLLGHQVPAAAAPRRQVGASVRPAPRRDHSLTADSDRGRLYVFGGRRGGRALADLWVFDRQQDTWTEAVVEGPRPEARFGHNASYDSQGGQLIVAFGQAGPTFFNDVWAFGLDSGVWTRIGESSPERPTPRYGSAAAFDPLSRTLLVTHGFTDRGRFDDTWAFDIAADQWRQITTAGAVPIKRCLARGAFDASSARLLMFGGQSDTAPFLGDLWSLELASGAWTELSTDVMPGARHLYAAAAAADGTSWHLLGGNTPAGPSTEHWMFQPAMNSWVLRDEVPGRVSHDAAILGDALFTFGGTDAGSELDELSSVPLT